MAWLVPSIIATMAGTALLSFVYYYLYLTDRKNYLATWSVSWFVYFLRYVLMLLFIITAPQHSVLLMGNQVASLLSGIILLRGTYQFIHKPFSKIWFYITVAGIAWIIAGIAGKFSFLVVSLPVFSLLAVIYIMTGRALLKSGITGGKALTTTGWIFIIWGIHKADYPFLRPVSWFAPFGYLIGAILEFSVALGILLVYFKKNEDTLRDERKRLSYILRGTNAGTWEWNIQTGETIFNERWAEIIGYTPAEITPASIDTWRKFCHPDDLENSNQLLEKHFQGELDDYECEVRMRHRDGSWIWVLDRGRVASRTADGRPEWMYGTHQDITKSKQAERKVRFQAKLLASVGQAVIATDTHGKITYWNKAAEQLYGWSINEVIGKDIVRINTTPENRNLAREIINSVSSGKNWSGEFHVRKKNGDRVPVLVNDTPMFDENNNLIGIIGVSADLTQIKKMEEQIRSAQKMESIGSLAGGIAHDFNNILSPIIGMSEMLLEDLKSDTILYENTREILKAGIRGRDLVKQILAFSRQSEHKMIPVRLQQVLNEALTLIRASIPSYIEIKQDIQSDCGLVMGDPTQIHQIAMNLITNAFHAVEDSGGTITISLKETCLIHSDFTIAGPDAGEYVLLSISDTGHGIPEDLIEKIFDPYFTTKEQGKGTGLGLAVVYGIVKEHKGEIKVFSEPGKGTTVNVYLPLMPKARESIPAEITEADRTGSERILLVDDEKAIAKLEKLVLERLGYKVTSRHQSTDAFETFRAAPDSFDLVITDMTMPYMTGTELVEKILSIRADIPIIMCTGFSEKINEEKAREKGIKGFLMKPVAKSELIKTVRRVLDSSKT